MKSTVTLIASFMLILAASVALAEDARVTASYEDFVEWGDRLEGRWVGKVTLIADWPGLDKKKGETVIGHVSRRWAADRRVIEESSFLANEEGRTMHYWDAAANQIKLVSVSSGGTTWVGSIGRDGDDKWPWTAEGTLPDGTKMEASGCDTLTRGGRQVVDGIVFSGDEKLPKLHDVYERVSK